MENDDNNRACCASRACKVGGNRRHVNTSFFFIEKTYCRRGIKIKNLKKRTKKQFVIGDSHRLASIHHCRFSFIKAHLSCDEWYFVHVMASPLDAGWLLDMRVEETQDTRALSSKIVFRKTCFQCC